MQYATVPLSKGTMQTISRASEARLVETLGELRDRPESWTFVAFHLNRLMDQYKSEFQIKIAVNLIYDLLRSFDGGIYVLGDGAIVALAADLGSQVQHKLVFQLRYLYMDDPLAYTAEGEENADFCTVYALTTQWTAAHQYCVKRMTGAARGSGVEVLAKPRPAADAGAPAAAPLTSVSAPKSGMLKASDLAALERDLANVDISRALRRQPVCASVAGGALKPVFNELYIQMNYLRQILRMEVDFLSNKWLFKYLTQTLDERILSFLKYNSARELKQPISININVQSLLSKAFAEFDAQLAPATRVSIVFEIPIVDVFADIDAYLVACGEVQKLGYRICIDGLSPHSLTRLNREKLGADLFKLQWNADLASDLKAGENKDLMEAVQRSGANRLILCRCDNRTALDYGKVLGISLYQGRYLDQLLDPKATIIN